jgi:molybdopterin/thiamine biosynthesis adenylyltransferase
LPHSQDDLIQEYSIDTFISLAKVQEISLLTGSNHTAIEERALELGITPKRYQRNQSTITPEAQLQLLHTHVAIIGTGGLGGHIAEILTRIGIGKLTLFDPDHFEEHNLNRQNFCTLETLGLPKVTVVKEALETVSPTVKIKAHIQKFDPEKDFSLIEQCDLIIDALDTPQTKLQLAKLCQEKQKPFVHGAIGGFAGQIGVDTTLEKLYPTDHSDGAEHTLGNPAFNVTFLASLQASEAIKSILGIGESLSGECMVTDLLYNDFEKLPL